MPKVVDHDVYRRELLERSYAVFVKLGYAESTMRVLARELGVSTGTLYHYFKTKEDLFEQLVRQKADDSKARIERFFASHEKPMSCRTLFTLAADLAHDRRDQQLLLMEFRRQNPERATALGDFSGWVTTMGDLLGTHDQRAIQLITSAMAGAIMMSDVVGKDWFVTQGGFLDELLALQTK